MFHNVEPLLNGSGGGKYNIQVYGLAPGYFKTLLTKPLYMDKKFDSWLHARTPAIRWGDPKELIRATIFFASKDSDYVIGHILYVNGGLTAVCNMSVNMNATLQSN